MALNQFLLREFYRDYWDFYKDKGTEGLKSYVKVALNPIYASDEAACEILEGFSHRFLVDIYNPLGQYLATARVFSCQPDAGGNVPEAVRIDVHGIIDVYRFRDTGFWKSFKENLTGIWKGPGFKIWLALVLPDVLGGSAVGKNVLAAAYWVEKYTAWFTDPVLRVMGQIDEWAKIQKYTTINNIWYDLIYAKEKVDAYIDPYISPWVEALNTANTTFKDLIADVKAANAAITGPLKSLSATILSTNSSMQQDFLKTINPIVKALGVFGYKEAQKWETDGRSWFDGIFDWVMDERTKLLKPSLKVENKLDSWIINTYTPIENRFKLVEDVVAAPSVGTIIRLVPDMGRIKPLVDAVIELEEGLAPENARLRKAPLQKTLDAYPATVMISSEDSQPIRKKLPYTPIPVVEGHLPVAEYWWKLLEMEGQNLYVDDKGQPLAPVMGKDGKYTIDKGNLRGRVYPITEAVGYIHADPLADIEARVLLYERCLLVSQVTAYYLSWDPWIKMGEWAIKDLTRTMFYSGSVGARVAEYIIPGLAPVDYTPQELMEQAKLQDDWLVKEFHVMERAVIEEGKRDFQFMTYIGPLY